MWPSLLLVWCTCILSILLYYVGSCVLKALFCGQVLINTLHQYPRLTLDRYLIDTPSAPELTFNQHFIDISVESQASLQTIHVSQSTVSQLSINCWSTVDRVSTEYWSRCWLSNWIKMFIKDMDRGYRSTLECECLEYTWSYIYSPLDITYYGELQLPGICLFQKVYHCQKKLWEML